MKKLNLFCLLTIIFIVSCDNPTDKINKENDPEYARVQFVNNTQFYVKVYRDTTVLLFDELAPGKSNTGNIRESTDNNVGTTFHFSYRFKLTEPNDTFSGEAFAVGTVGDLEETFVIEKGKEYSRNIPIPENISFNEAYIRIKNKVSYNVLLTRIGSQRLQLGNRELMIPSGKTGIYNIENSYLNMSDYHLQNVDIPYDFPQMTMEPGYVYDYFISEEGITTKIIADTQWKIKPEPTSTWKKAINTYNSSNFNNTDLNSHLMSINRRLDISNWRSNYPKNKILTYNNSLISGEWGFGVIPVIIQNTGVVAPYEIPLIIAKDNEWTSSFIPNTNFYVGTSNLAYQTTFNDMINLGNNFVILTTYSNEKRSGICLFFINGQGQLIVKMDIVPENDLLGYTGTNLVKLDGNNFLVLGNKKQYTSADDEHFTASKAIIYKCQMGNNTVWSAEYGYPLHYANLSICGMEAADSYIICGTASDNSSTKTIILKINKNDGNIDDVKTIGTANDSWRPFSVCSDKTGNIYISGIATEGASSKAYILKLNSSFEQIWLKKYGNNYDNFLFDINITDNLLTAVGSSNDGSVIDPLFYGWQAGKGWVLRIDTDTGIIVNEIFDNTVTGYNSIVRLNDGGFVYSAIKSIDNTKPYWFNTFAVKVNEHLGFGK